MLKKLFGKKEKMPHLIQAEYGAFTIEPWVLSGDAVNGNSFSDKAKARGRYEIAEQFHILGTEYYEKNVVGGMSGDGQEMLEKFRSHLTDLHLKDNEFQALVRTRRKILDLLAWHPNGIDRKDLNAQLQHEGSTSWGVICNQLAKGGFLFQEKQGNKYILKPNPIPPKSNQDFLIQEIPQPNTSGFRF